MMVPTAPKLEPICASAPNKLALLRLCQHHDVALMENDTYSALVDDSVLREDPMQAIKSWDDSGHVVYCASLHICTRTAMQPMMQGRQLLWRRCCAPGAGCGSLNPRILS